MISLGYATKMAAAARLCGGRLVNGNGSTLSQAAFCDIRGFIW